MQTLFHKFILVFLLSGVAGTAVAGTVVLATGAWMPYINKVGHEPQGYVIEILKKVMCDAGHSVVAVNMPYARALQSVSEGEVDVIAGVREDEIDRDKVITNQLPVGINVFSFFVNSSSNWVYKGIDSLTGKNLGLVAGENYPELTDYLSASKNRKNLQFLSGDDPFARNIKKLLAGRLEVVLDNRNVVNYYRHYFDAEDKIKYAGDLGPPIDLYVIFSRHNPKATEYSHLLDKGIQAMRNDGSLAKLLARYHVEDWSDE